MCKLRERIQNTKNRKYKNSKIFKSMKSLHADQFSFTASKISRFNYSNNWKLNIQRFTTYSKWRIFFHTSHNRLYTIPRKMSKKSFQGTLHTICIKACVLACSFVRCVYREPRSGYHQAVIGCALWPSKHLLRLSLTHRYTILTRLLFLPRISSRSQTYRLSHKVPLQIVQKNFVAEVRKSRW